MKITDSMIERAYDVLNSGDFRDRGDLVREALEAALAPYQDETKTPAAAEPKPEIGQIWRRRTPTSGGQRRHVRVEHVPDKPYGDVHWVTADNTRGPATGSVWAGGWARQFTYVEGP